MRLSDTHLTSWTNTAQYPPGKSPSDFNHDLYTKRAKVSPMCVCVYVSNGCKAIISRGENYS